MALALALGPGPGPGHGDPWALALGLALVGLCAHLCAATLACEESGVTLHSIRYAPPPNVWVNPPGELMELKEWLFKRSLNLGPHIRILGYISSSGVNSYFFLQEYLLTILPSVLQ